jgi:hypothetical protein
LGGHQEIEGRFGPLGLVRKAAKEPSLLTRPARSAYGSFQAHSARTGSDSGTRASGRSYLFGMQRRNGRYLRIYRRRWCGPRGFPPTLSKYADWFDPVFRRQARGGAARVRASFAPHPLSVTNQLLKAGLGPLIDETQWQAYDP